MAFLSYIASRLPFHAEFISVDIMKKRREEAEEIARRNINPFDANFVIRYNMQNCNSWLSVGIYTNFDLYSYFDKISEIRYRLARKIQIDAHAVIINAI